MSGVIARMAHGFVVCSGKLAAQHSLLKEE
jgi:hypothetical protein